MHWELRHWATCRERWGDSTWAATQPWSLQFSLIHVCCLCSVGHWLFSGELDTASRYLFNRYHIIVMKGKPAGFLLPGQWCLLLRWWGFLVLYIKCLLASWETWVWIPARRRQWHLHASMQGSCLRVWNLQVQRLSRGQSCLARARWNPLCQHKAFTCLSSFKYKNPNPARINQPLSVTFSVVVLLIACV